MISYTQKNDTAAKLAVALYYKLREMGYNVWLDVQADDKSEAAMKKNVEGAKFVIAIISDGAGVEGCAYFERPFCVKELRWAIEASKPIQPVVRAEDKMNIGTLLMDAPEDLRHLGGIDFIDVDPRGGYFAQKAMAAGGSLEAGSLLSSSSSIAWRWRTAASTSSA